MNFEVMWDQAEKLWRSPYFNIWKYGLFIQNLVVLAHYERGDYGE